jgi:hypothetical protein
MHGSYSFGVLAIATRNKFFMCSRNWLRLAAINRNHRSDAADLFPPAAERFIELNQALILVVSRLRQREFRLEQGSLAIEDV